MTINCLLLVVKQLMDTWSLKIPQTHQVRLRRRINPHTSAWTWWAFSHTQEHFQKRATSRDHVSQPIAVLERSRPNASGEADCWATAPSAGSLTSLPSPLHCKKCPTTPANTFTSSPVLWRYGRNVREGEKKLRILHANRFFSVKAGLDKGVLTQEGWWVLF